jgi:hypothetical protein
MKTLISEITPGCPELTRSNLLRFCFVLIKDDLKGLSERYGSN